jgi:hypothetical protein
MILSNAHTVQRLVLASALFAATTLVCSANVHAETASIAKPATISINPASRVNLAALNPQPLPPNSRARFGARHDLAALNPQPLPPESTGSEMSMIQLQSTVSQRGTTLQLTGNMIRSINDSSKTVAGNIGR